MGTSLVKASLRGSYLRGAKLIRANLGGTDLSKADLWEANLTGANLSGANLSEANLRRANLDKAFLWKTDLSKARGWTLDGLEQSDNLVGAIMPDGVQIGGFDLPYPISGPTFEEWKEQYLSKQGGTESDIRDGQ
jgi:uncharacterized protein YjbI with pentapeptide repeats